MTFKDVTKVKFFLGCVGEVVGRGPRQGPGAGVGVGVGRGMVAAIQP